MNTQFKKGQLVAVNCPAEDDRQWHLRIFKEKRPDGHFVAEDDKRENWAWQLCRSAEEVWSDIFLGRERRAGEQAEQQLKWTKRRPEKAGWYWSKFINSQYPSHKAAITVMHVTVTHNRYKANGVPLDEICRYGTRLWAGPLTPPDAGDREDG